MATVISDGKDHTKEELDTLCGTEYIDFIKIIRSVITNRFINKSLDEKKKLLLMPQKFLLEGPDGIVMVLLEKKAVPVHNIIRRMGLISLVSNNILPLATENMGILQIYLGLDKIKLLTLDLNFISLLDDSINNKKEIEDRLISCIIHNSFIELNNVEGSMEGATPATNGGKRKTRHSKSKYRKTRVRR